MHLIVDGYGGDTGKMWDIELVRNFLSEYPSTLGMTKLSGPQMVTYNGPNAEDNGVSGMVIIAESHISIHTFPNRSYVNVDVFSCKTFDDQRVLEDVKRLFAFTDVRTWVLDRGLEHLDRRKALEQVETR